MVPQERNVIDWDTFNAKRQLWQEQGITSYSFTLDYSGYVFPSWKGTVVVKDGGLMCFIPDEFVIGREYGDPSSNERIMKWIDTFDGIYNEIADLGNSASSDTGYYYNLKIDYDNEYYFPIYFDCNIGQKSLIHSSGDGSSFNFTITDFIPNPVIKENITTFNSDIFNTEQSLWLAQSIPNYSFHLDYHYDNDDFILVDGNMVKTGSIYKGTIIVKNGQLYTSIIDTDNKGIPLGFTYIGAWRWIDSLSGFFNTILADGAKNPGLEWGCASQSTLDVEYDDVYHYPSYYKYLAQEIPGMNDTGKQRLYEFSVTNFTITE